MSYNDDELTEDVDLDEEETEDDAFADDSPLDEDYLDDEDEEDKVPEGFLDDIEE